jgi:hypothetical protein
MTSNWMASSPKCWRSSASTRRSAPSRVFGASPPDLLHVLVVAAQFLTHLGQVQRLGFDGAGGAQDNEQVAQRGTHAAGMAGTGRAMALGQVAVDELCNESLVDVGKALLGALQPHRQMRHRRFAAASIASGIATIGKVLVVRRDVAIQLDAAARAARRIETRSRLGRHGSLQVVEPPVHPRSETMYRCPRRR